MVSQPKRGSCQRVSIHADTEVTKLDQAIIVAQKHQTRGECVLLNDWNTGDKAACAVFYVIDTFKRKLEGQVIMCHVAGIIGELDS